MKYWTYCCQVHWSNQKGLEVVIQSQRRFTNLDCRHCIATNLHLRISVDWGVIANETGFTLKLKNHLIYMVLINKGYHQDWFL